MTTLHIPDLPADPIRHCLAMALTYHQRKPAQ